MVAAEQQTWISPEEHHHHRLAIAYRVASLILIALGSLWLVWMTIEQRWALVALNVGYMAAGVFMWRSVNRKSFHLVAALVHVFLFLVIAQICLLYDIPSDAAPRVTHLYFLAMAFLFYVTFRQHNLPLTYAVVLVYLGGFVIFSSTSFAAPFAEPLPDAMRGPGAWIHSVVAVTIMCACIQIMQSDYAARARLSKQLTTALAEKQFELYLQPQVDLDHTILGAEALLRWKHPKRGIVPPGEFIAAAEQLGVMRPIGRWVLEAACERLAAWQKEPGRAHLKLAVNVSASQFRDEAFVADVKDVVQRHGIDPQRLELELTENVVVNDFEDVIVKMDSLVAFGIGLSLDDFGTGYSSLKYLKRMPFSQLKIDQGFVRDMMHDDRDAVIVKGIVQLGNELHLSVIAEGVETVQQRNFLVSLGCTKFQGYLFGRPMPAEDFERLAATGLRDAAAA
jgi:EAL domain-containing protein (putative c-di-GMP-specific phosphodiesterase class I)